MSFNDLLTEKAPKARIRTFLHAGVAKYLYNIKSISGYLPHNRRGGSGTCSQQIYFVTSYTRFLMEMLFKCIVFWHCKNRKLFL